jgi:hypothetical protein
MKNEFYWCWWWWFLTQLIRIVINGVSFNCCKLTSIFFYFYSIRMDFNYKWTFLFLLFSNNFFNEKQFCTVRMKHTIVLWKFMISLSWDHATIAIESLIFQLILEHKCWMTFKSLVYNFLHSRVHKTIFLLSFFLEATLCCEWNCNRDDGKSCTQFVRKWKEIFLFLSFIPSIHLSLVNVVEILLI